MANATDDSKADASSVDEGLRTLLIIDDEPNILAALARVFHSEGWKVLLAGSSKAAFQHLARHRVGVILCDQVMPDASGTALLQATRPMCPDAVHVVLTGSVELDVVARAVEDGDVFKIVRKPWEDDELRQVVRDAFIRYSTLQNQ